MVSQRDDEGFCLNKCQEVFKGHILAARWWHKYHRGPLERNKDSDRELSLPVKVAMKELVRYTLESLPTLERYMEPERLLTIGFEMGLSFQKALAAGELECENDTEVEVPFALPRGERKKFDLESLFSPQRPDDAM